MIYADRTINSVNSRLIGEEVKARLGLETVEIWCAGRQTKVLPRLRGRAKHRVDYRHIIDWLVRKLRCCVSLPRTRWLPRGPSELR